MKPLPLPSKILFLATKLFGVLLASLFTNTVFAATNHWSGTSCAAPVVGSCDWSAADASSGDNWVELTTPANNGTADIIFLGATALTPHMDRSWNVHSVLFDTTAGAFVCSGGGNTLTIQAGGMANNSLNVQTIGLTGSGSPITLGASQTWSANLANLVIHLSSPVSFNGKDLTIAGVSNVSIFPKIGGSGRLIKNDTGTLFLGQSGAFNTNFTGSVIVNDGTLEIDGSQTIRKASSITLNGGTLVLNRQNSIGSSTTSMIFNGGKLSAIAPNSLVNPSDFFGTLVISNTSSSIDLNTNDTFNASLTFAAGSLAGTGTLTINGWTGVAGQSGTDDKIFVSTNPGAALLSAIRFTGFPAGATWLGTGEIVPPAPALVPPTLISPMRLSDTAFQFVISGSAGHSYTIQVSSTFTNWTDVLTTNAPSDIFTVIDSNATNDPAFYRVLANP